MTRRKSSPGELFARPDPPVARVRKYVDRQLRAQRHLGSLEPVDDGLVGIVMTMADTIDAEVQDRDGSRFVVLSGCKQLAGILLDLRGDRWPAAATSEADAELATLVAALRDAANPGP